MSYFKTFPSIQYQFPDDQIKFYKNLSIRPAVVQALKNDLSNLQVYDVEDGETPETIAFDVYKDQSLNWIIMLVNDVMNLYTDWPMSEAFLEDYLFEKYKNQTATDGTAQTLTKAETNEFIEFLGTPDNNYTSTISLSNGKSVTITPRHFVDANKTIFSFNSLGATADAYGRSIIRPTLTPISYRAHEINLNDEKRKIFIPSFKIANQMKRDLGAIVNA